MLISETALHFAACRQFASEATVNGGRIARIAASGRAMTLADLTIGRVFN